MAGKLDPKKVNTLTKESQTVKDMDEDFGANGKYTVTQSGNTWILNSNDNTGERFMFIDNNGDYKVLDTDQVRAAYVKDANARDGIDGLRTRLYKAGYINKVEYNSKDATALSAGIIKAARKVTIDAVTKFTDTRTPLTTSFDSFLGREAQYNALGDGPTSGISLSTRTETDQDIDEFFTEYLGRRATPAEKTEYYTKVNKEEKAAVKKTTVSGEKQTSIGGYLDETDYYRLRADVLKPAVKGTNIEDITKGNGKIAKDVADIKAFAADYGIKMDTKQALDKVYSGLTPGGTLTTGNLDSQKTSIREMSKAFYGKLAPLIDQGVKVSDIASQFAYYKGQTLELADNAVSVFDEDIQTALKNEGKDGVMTLTDYQKLLRTDPKTKSVWLKTKGAKEEASGYAYEILKSFGLMA
jgi:hypothetical protein